MFPPGLCEFFQAKALQKLSFIWNVFGNLKFPNTSILMKERKAQWEAAVKEAAEKTK